MLSVEQLVPFWIGFDFGLGKVSAPVAVAEKHRSLESSVDTDCLLIQRYQVTGVSEA